MWDIESGTNYAFRTIAQMIRRVGEDANFDESEKGPEAGEFHYQNVAFVFSSIRPGAKITLKEAQEVLTGIRAAANDPERRYVETARIIIKQYSEQTVSNVHGTCYFIGHRRGDPGTALNLSEINAINGTYSDLLNQTVSNFEESNASEDQYETM